MTNGVRIVFITSPETRVVIWFLDRYFWVHCNWKRFKSTAVSLNSVSSVFVYISLSSGSEASQLQQGRGSWNQGDYWGVYLPKERGTVSACPHHCPVFSQQGPRGALLSFLPCLISSALLLWRWDLRCQQQCRPHYTCRVSDFCYAIVCMQMENIPQLASSWVL